jgi:predicted enzyme related to lactoylglutathione lyase
MNIGSYFEIPVVDMNRAIDFYQKWLGIKLEKGSIDKYEMAFFPFENNGVGISGALVKGDVYKPSINGVFLYLRVENIDSAIGKAVDLGSEVMLPKTEGDSWFVAEIKDSEGNRICLKQDFNQVENKYNATKNIAKTLWSNSAFDLNKNSKK